MALARIRIDTEALQHNLALVREAAPGRKVLAVVKADAYGHGMLVCAQALQHADGFTVARLEEALLLRSHFPESPILILGLESTQEAWQLCSRHRLAAVIHREEDARLLSNLNLPAPVAVWLKIDTGMHRVGLAPEQVSQVFRQLQVSAAVSSVVLMTHLACADETRNPFTAEQLAVFHAARHGLMAVNGLAAETSLANSAGILAWPDSHGDWVRPGIALYGADPLDRSTPLSTRLKPVMRLSSTLVAIRNIQAGERVGYGGSWAASRPSRIGTVAIGYGDGYPRSAPNGTPVWIGDRCVPLVGRVSMDLITVDLTEHPSAQVGDAAELWGKHVSLNTVAECSGTISYELTTRLTGRPVREIGPL